MPRKRGITQLYIDIERSRPMAPRKIDKQMKELAQLAYERDLSRCIDVLHAQMSEWKDGRMSVWDIDQSIHEFHNKIARGLYRSYAMTDTFLAVAFGVAQDVLSIEDIPESEKAKIQDVATRINRGMKA
jgi:hypothetical protein